MVAPEAAATSYNHDVQTPTMRKRVTEATASSDGGNDCLTSMAERKEGRLRRRQQMRRSAMLQSASNSQCAAERTRVGWWR